MTSYASPTTVQAQKEHRLLTVLHWLSLPLILAILGVGAYRTWGIQSAISNRMDIVVITAAGKSVLCLLYILLTTHVFKGAYSPFAVFIIAIIDSLFWIAALGLTAYGIVQIPSTGTREILNYVLIALVAIAFVVSLPILYLSWRQNKHVKAARRAGLEPEVGHVREEYMYQK